MNAYLFNVKVLGYEGIELKDLENECTKFFKVKKKYCEATIKEFMTRYRYSYLERSKNNIYVGLVVVFLGGLVYLLLFLLSERVILKF